LCNITQQFVSVPVIYTTYSRAKDWAPLERRQLSFVLVKAQPSEDHQALCQRIRAQTGLAAYTRDDFSYITLMYYLEHTGIPINFGTTVGLGFIVGVAIAGQTFYQFAHDNMRYFGTLKAMGCSNLTLVRMILLQGLTAGGLGYAIGIGGTAAFKFVIGEITPASQHVMAVHWWILALGAAAVMFIVVVSSMLALIKVVRLEPAIVFK
jgi:putative ABC transport system permease protein